jgi:hypothetical protein
VRRQKERFGIVFLTDRENRNEEYGSWPENGRRGGVRPGSTKPGDWAETGGWIRDGRDNFSAKKGGFFRNPEHSVGRIKIDLKQKSVYSSY